MIRTLVARIWPTSLISNEHYDINFAFTSGTGDKKLGKHSCLFLIFYENFYFKLSFYWISDILSFKHAFDREAIGCLILSLGIGVWYLLKKVRLTLK